MPLSNTDFAIVPGSDLSSPVVYRGRWKVRRKADKNATLKRGFGHSSRVGSQLSSGLQSKVEGRERKDQERPGGTLTHSSKGDIQTHLGTAVARRETETLEKPDRKGDRSKKVLETLKGQKRKRDDAQIPGVKSRGRMRVDDEVEVPAYLSIISWSLPILYNLSSDQRQPCRQATGNLGDSEHEGALQQKAAMMGALMAHDGAIVSAKNGHLTEMTGLLEPGIRDYQLHDVRNKHDRVARAFAVEVLLPDWTRTWGGALRPSGGEHMLQGRKREAEDRQLEDGRMSHLKTRLDRPCAPAYWIDRYSPTAFQFCGFAMPRGVTRGSEVAGHQGWLKIVFQVFQEPTARRALCLAHTLETLGPGTGRPKTGVFMRAHTRRRDDGEQIANFDVASFSVDVSVFLQVRDGGGKAHGEDGPKPPSKSLEPCKNHRRTRETWIEMTAERSGGDLWLFGNRVQKLYHQIQYGLLLPLTLRSPLLSDTAPAAHRPLFKAQGAHSIPFPSLLDPVHRSPELTKDAASASFSSGAIHVFQP
ncbi:hypothetical protein C8R47DRAFT_1252206 [Mycena vitilis]|nr:hypothetical protein C8R47DRAFT_1252206 [Mycena vitilis]